VSRWLAAAILAFAAAAIAGQEAGPWLTGQFLVASDEMSDPRFEQTVVYMVQHDEHGAMGLIVNRPMADVPLARILEPFGLDTAGVTGDMRVHIGGPVDVGRGFLLHTADYVDSSTRRIRDGIAMTADREIFDAIAHGRGPRRSLFALGYAGWAAGQLEGEIRRGSWITVPADEALLFDKNSDRKWERAKARQRIDL